MNREALIAKARGAIKPTDSIELVRAFEYLAAEQAHTPTDDYPDAEGLATLRAVTPSDDERVSLMGAATDAFAKHEGAPTWQDDPVGRDAALRWHMRGFEDGLNARRIVQGEPCSCQGEYVTALDLVDGCKCGRLKPFDQMTDNECNEAAAVQGEPSAEARAIIRRVREFATKERDIIRGRYGAGSAGYAGYANACDDILGILDGETPCEPQGVPILQCLADEYGVTADELSEMVSRGEQEGENR